MNGRIYEVVSGKVSVVHEEHNDATEKISVDPSSTCSDPTSTSVELYTLGPHEFIGVNVCSSRTLHSKNPSIFHMIFKFSLPNFFRNFSTMMLQHIPLLLQRTLLFLFWKVITSMFTSNIIQCKPEGMNFFPGT